MENMRKERKDYSLKREKGLQSLEGSCSDERLDLAHPCTQEAGIKRHLRPGFVALEESSWGEEWFHPVVIRVMTVLGSWYPVQRPHRSRSEVIDLLVRVCSSGRNEPLKRAYGPKEARCQSLS